MTHPLRLAVSWLMLAAAVGCGGEPDASAGGEDPGLGGSGATAGSDENAPEPDLGGAGGEAGAPAVTPEPGGGAAGAAGATGAAGEGSGEAGAAGANSEAPEEEGVGSTPPASCPANGPPSGPFTWRFDVATLQCGAAGVCTGAEDKCLCKPDFDALAAIPGHFLAVSSDLNKATTWGSGNLQAVYVDDLNTDWKLGGAARADALVTQTAKKFPCGVPKWFVMNEISPSIWKALPEYRQFVIDFAKRMKGSHGKSVVIAAPFQTVSANASSWTELGKHAFIGVEAYLSGREIKDQGFSLAWCQAQYAASVAAYAKQGVPKSRLFLFEHFGNTGTVLDSGIPVRWGRQAVSAADWHKAIKVRSQAAKAVGFAGFVSYDWGANGIHAPESDRLAFMNTYRGQQLP